MSSLEVVSEDACSRILTGTVPLSLISMLTEYPINRNAFEFQLTTSQAQEFYQKYLPNLMTQIFEGYLTKGVVPSSLLERIISKGKSDVIFSCLIQRLTDGSLNESHQFDLLIIALETFIFQYLRVPRVFQLALSDKPVSIVDKAILEELSRSVTSIPSKLANVVRGSHNSKLLDRSAFVNAVLSSFSVLKIWDHPFTELCALTIGHLTLSGNSLEVTRFLVSRLSDQAIVDEHEFWSTCFLYLEPNCIEPLMSNLLKESSTPRYVQILLKKAFQNPSGCISNCFLKVFRRLIFVRYFPNSSLTHNLFAALGEIVHENCDSGLYLFQKVNKSLGYPVARLWSDAASIRTTSIEQRLYISQSFVSWFTRFYLPLITRFQPDISEDNLLTDVLSGISNHLSSPRREIRIVGMALGERIIQKFPFINNLDKDGYLKFDYAETDLVRKIKTFFDPISPEISSTNQDFKSESSMKELADEGSELLDSDDDEEVNIQSLGLLSPLKPDPDYGQQTPVSSDTRKPRYLRECLDGLLLSKPEDGHISVMCWSAAADLIREHPGVAKELVNDIAGALLHSQPPMSTSEQTFSAYQHSALVALGVVAPKECSRYLMNEFVQTTCPLNQRQTILTALTDVARELSDIWPKSGVGANVHLSTADVRRHLPIQSENSRTRRFCSPAPVQKQSVNKFVNVAGDFFFPLLNTVPQLHSPSQRGFFAHHDASILAQTIGSLGTIYACAHSSPIQWRMAYEFIELLPTIYCHSEPAVRQASLLALETIMNATPSIVFATKLTFLFKDLTFSPDDSSYNLINWLNRCSVRDTDNECRVLASTTLRMLMETARSVQPMYIE